MKHYKILFLASMVTLFTTYAYANTVNMAPVISYLLSGNALTLENKTSIPLVDGGSSGSGTAISEINVTGATTSITKVTITLDITHTWISDIEIRLISPSETSIVLSSVNEVDGEDYTNTTFDDSAITSITDAFSPFTGTYSPEQPLALFSGENANGIWKLQIDDTVWGDTGTLNSWSITLE